MEQLAPAQARGSRPADRGPLAIAMTGGGARAAYQVGVLRYLGRQRPSLAVPILTGVSAGGINAAHLGSYPGDFGQASAELARLWVRLEPGAIYDTRVRTLAASVMHFGLQALSGGLHVGPPLRGMLDTAPLHRLLRAELPNRDGRLVGVRENIERGRLQALAITTTDYGTGQTVTWVEGREVRHWRRPRRRSMAAELTTDHVLASAALPLLFPAVRLGNVWHGDGGIRLTAPLSPALHLGATRILAISNRHERSLGEAETPVIHGYPPPAQVVGTLLNAVFLDNLDFDALNMRRINALLARCRGRTPTMTDDGPLRPVEVMVIRPSRDLGRLAARFELRLPRSLRFFTRGLGTRETETPDALSMLMFQSDYLRAVVDLGEADAEARGPELLAFVEGSSAADAP